MNAVGHNEAFSFACMEEQCTLSLRKSYQSSSVGFVRVKCVYQHYD